MPVKKSSQNNAAAALARMDAAKAAALLDDDEYAEASPAAQEPVSRMPVELPAEQAAPATVEHAPEQPPAASHPPALPVHRQPSSDASTAAQLAAGTSPPVVERPGASIAAPGEPHAADRLPQQQRVTSAVQFDTDEGGGPREDADGLNDELPDLDLTSGPLAEAVDPTGFEIPPQLHALVMREAARQKNRYRSPQTQILLAALEEAAPHLPRLVAEDGRQVVDSPLFGRRIVEAPVARGTTKRLQVRPKWEEHALIKQFANRLGVPTVVVVRAALRYRYREQLAAQDKRAVSGGKSGVGERS